MYPGKGFTILTAPMFPGAWASSFRLLREPRRTQYQNLNPLVDKSEYTSSFVEEYAQNLNMNLRNPKQQNKLRRCLMPEHGGRIIAHIVLRVRHFSYLSCTMIYPENTILIVKDPILLNPDPCNSENVDTLNPKSQLHLLNHTKLHKTLTLVKTYSWDKTKTRSHKP